MHHKYAPYTGIKVLYDGVVSKVFIRTQNACAFAVVCFNRGAEKILLARKLRAVDFSIDARRRTDRTLRKNVGGPNPSGGGIVRKTENLTTQSEKFRKIF